MMRTTSIPIPVLSNLLFHSSSHKHKHKLQLKLNLLHTTTIIITNQLHLNNNNNNNKTFNPLLIHKQKQAPTCFLVPTINIIMSHYLSIKTLTTSASISGESSTGVGREIMVQHLLVKEDDSKLLYELQKRIIRGEGMSDLAVDYSICPSKEEGGMLGWVRRGQMVPEFEEAAFNAPLNKVVKCKTKFGWHLLQVLSEREESVLEDIQPRQLHEKLQDPSFLEEAQLIDVREPYEVDMASLPGFQVLPLRQFGNWGPELTTKFDTEKDTYVLCHHGVRSLQVAQWLQTQGFKKVFNVSGGIHAYAVNVDPTIPTY